MNSDRTNTILLPTSEDKVIACCGGGNKTCEERSWDESSQDYTWKPVTVAGLENFEKPDEFTLVQPSFYLDGIIEDRFPDLNPNSRYIFGSEIEPVLIEIPENLKLNFYPSPMRFQQKTGQVCHRLNPNEILIVSGSDATYTRFSRKSFKFYIKEKKVEKLGYLKRGRYNHTLVEHNVS